jgi:hypothetical protein
MNLKNYTSSVPAEITVARIEQILARAGATGVMKEYEAGELAALTFRLTLPDSGQPVAIRLPVKVEAVYAQLVRQLKRRNPTTIATAKAQARRTAWKLMQDWIEVQISLIQMQQADFMQVFLPYVWNGQATFYQALKADNFRALPRPQP